MKYQMKLGQHAVKVTANIENIEAPYTDVHEYLKIIMEISINRKKGVQIPMQIRYLKCIQYDNNA